MDGSDKLEIGGLAMKQRALCRPTQGAKTEIEVTEQEARIGKEIPEDHTLQPVQSPPLQTRPASQPAIIAHNVCNGFYSVQRGLCSVCTT